MERIIIFVERKKDLELIKGYIDQKYEVVEGSADFLEEPFDMAIFDLGFLERLKENALKRKEGDELVFLPYLIITEEQNYRSIPEWVWEVADEAMISPFERLKLEKRLEVLLRTRSYSKKLKKANDLKDLFMDIMHHDLGNPLAITKGFLEALLEEEKDPERINELRISLRSINRAFEIIDDSKKLSKLVGTKKVDFRDLYLDEVIASSIENLKPEIEKAGMVIENRIKGIMEFHGNKVIEEVFDNLISNAIKYGKDGKRIILENEEIGSNWRIKIIDFGEGIDDEFKKGLFQRFSRKEKKGIKGSGLGLAIVKRIADLHNGSIWVEDNIPHGSVFVVELPKNTDNLV